MKITFSSVLTRLGVKSSDSKTNDIFVEQTEPSVTLKKCKSGDSLRPAPRLNIKRPMTPQHRPVTPTFNEFLVDDMLMSDLVQFAEKEYSSENFNLYQNVQEIKTTSDKRQVKKKAQQVYEHYIKPGAAEEANVEEHLKQEIAEKLMRSGSQVEPTIFESIELSVMRNMQDTYSRYYQKQQQLLA